MGAVGLKIGELGHESSTNDLECERAWVTENS